MILYDLVAMQPQGNVKSHGGGTFAYIVFKRMVERQIHFCAFFDSTRYLDSEVFDLAEENGIKLYDISKTSFEDIINKLEKPLVYSILPKPYMCISKVIGTIHDCRELELENDFWEWRYGITLKSLIKKLYILFFNKHYLRRESSKLNNLLSNKNFSPTTITYYTKYKLICNFPKLDFSSIPVFPTPFTLSASVEACTNKEKYFLFVSGDRWLKNVLRGVVALDELFTCGYLNDFKVIITGLRNIDDYHYQVKNRKKFACLGYVDNNKLQDLYKHAFAFIFPSLNEGFGIPPLEAMKYGTPVIASNKTAIPEVCGDAVLYINPFSIEDIKAKILMLSNEKDIYEELVEKGYNKFRDVALKSINCIDNYIDYVISRKNESKIQ